MPPTRLSGQEIKDGSIQRIDLDTTTAGRAVITKAVSSSDVAISSTGVDAGTGDVTFTLTTTGVTTGTWSKVTVDSKGRVTVGSNLTGTDLPSGSSYYIQNQSATPQTASLWVTGAVSGSALRAYNAAGTFYVGIAPPVSIAASYTFVLPASYGSNNQGLITDGSGNLSWSNVVSSVGLSLPASIFNVTVSSVTTTGTLTAVLQSQTANYFFAAPNGSAGAPTFRALVVADMPASAATPGAYGSASSVATYTVDGYGRLTAAGSTSISISTAQLTDLSTWSGSTALVTLGTVTTGTWSGTAIVANRGGTGQTAYVLGNLLYADTVSTLAKLAPNTAATKQFLSMTGTGSAGAAPTWGVLAASDIPSGSTYYVQNQTVSAQATTSFWVSGSGSMTLLRLYNGANYVSIAAGTLGGNLAFTWPVNTGTSGQVLSTDGAGVLSFIAAPWVRSGTQVNLATTTDKVTIGSTSNNAGALGIDSGSIQLKQDVAIISLIHFSGKNGSRQIIDLVGNRWACVGQVPAALSTAQAKFDTSSLLLNGTSQYLECEGTSFSGFAVGTGSFTVDLQLRFVATTGTQVILDAGGTAGGLVVRYVSGTGIQAVIAGTTFSFAWSPSTGTWYHVAVVRNGTSLAAYVNGAQIGSTQTSSGSIAVAYQPTIGATGRVGGTANVSSWLSAYVDEFRFSNIAQWTTTFTAPTVAYDYGTLTQFSTNANDPTDAGSVLVSDAAGNASLQSPRRQFIAEFALSEGVGNTSIYFYSWRAKGATQDNAARSGSSSGMPLANACSPIVVPFNGRIVKAILCVNGAGVNQATATYPCAYNVSLYRVGWAAEQDPAVNGGSPNLISFPIAANVGGYSVATNTNAVVETSLNIQVATGDRLALKFVHGSTAAIVGLTQMAFVNLIIEEVL